MNDQERDKHQDISNLLFVGLIAVLTTYFLGQLGFNDLYNPDDYCSVDATWSIIEKLESEKNVYIDNHFYYNEDYERALSLIWEEYNYGGGGYRNYDHLKYLENQRIKTSFTNVKSFNLINLSNPKPREPYLKFSEVTTIKEYIEWDKTETGYSKTIVESGSVYSNCGWHPYPINKTSTIAVFSKDGKYDCQIYELSVYPNIIEQTNASWNNYNRQLNKYYKLGGV